MIVLSLFWVETCCTLKPSSKLLCDRDIGYHVLDALIMVEANFLPIYACMRKSRK